MKITLTPEPHAVQRKVLQSCLTTSANMYTIVVAGRQGGKSTTAKHQTVAWALNHPGCRIWYVMPSEQQCIGIWRDICSSLAGTGLIKSKKASSGSIEIIFTNGTLLEFRSGSSGALRGTPINFLILDEAAYLKRSVVESDILPALNVAGKKVLICSTPKGKNWLYQFYLLGQDPSQPNYKSFKFLSTDNPAANLNAIELAKERTSEAIFAQEYLAEFVDGAEVFKHIDEVCSIKKRIKAPEPDKRYYCGIDIGLVTDETVITMFDSNGVMAYMDRFTGVPSPEVVQRIVSTLRLWKPIKCWIEENNQGLTILDYVRKEYKNVEGFKTTNQSKEEIINRLIAAFNGKQLSCFDDDEVKLQLQAFIFEMTSTGKVRYRAADGFHDDIVISMALAWCLYIETKLTGGYFVGGPAEVNSSAERKLTSLLKDNIKTEGNRENFNGDDNQEFIFFR